MRRWTPSIVIVLTFAALTVTAGSIEPEWKAWDRDQLEAAYVKKLEECARLHRELAAAKKQIAELTPEPAAEPANADAGAQVKVFKSIDDLVMSGDAAARKLSTPVSQAAAEYLADSLKEAVGKRLETRLEVVSSSSKLVVWTGQLKLNGVPCDVYLKQRLAIDKAGVLAIHKPAEVTGTIDSITGYGRGGAVALSIVLAAE